MSTLALDCVCGHIKARSVQCTSLSSVEIYNSVLYIATVYYTSGWQHEHQSGSITGWN